MKEAFVYRWYDAPNDMYYLGKHKGSQDDTYTHSSTIWESFTKDNIPEGVTRRILAYGTDEEMCILENELLVKAKNGGDWDRYYNESLGDPRYVDQYGENNSQWKGGIKVNDPKAYMKKYNQLPKILLAKKAYRESPEGKLKRKECDQRPENRESAREKRAKLKVETGYTHGYSRAKKKTETQGEGNLEAFLK